MIKSFFELDIMPEIKEALVEMGFSEPTPIQAEVIPALLERKDVMAQAPTGTGKTCAFGIPLINNITDDQDIQALILCPTRELCLQTTEELTKVAKNLPKIKILSIYGGQNIERQLFGLRKRPQIIVGTPGRVIDHLNRKTLKIENLKTLVLDESDEMLNMGFREDIDTILSSVSGEHQTVMFSATMPKEILKISEQYQHDPISVRTTFNANSIPQIEQFFIKVKDSEKISTLTSLIDDNNYKLCLVFCCTKKRTDELANVLIDYGYNAMALHGDLQQKSRDAIMRKFRTGDIRILVATDVAARGIDVDDIEAIFNFDIPQDEEYYVHRIGRTARANKTGVAYTFIKENQLFAIKDYEKFTKTKMTKLDSTASESVIDQKKVNSVLNQIGDKLDVFKEFITSELDQYNIKNNTTYTYLDFAASMLKQGNDVPSLSQGGRETKREKMGAQTSTSRLNSARPNNVGRKVGKRFFINLGSKDRLDDVKIAAHIASITNVPAENIFNINILDTFSFVEVEETFAETILKLNGTQFGKRRVSIELADQGAKKSPDERRARPANDDRRPSTFGGEERRPSTFGGEERRPSTFGGDDRKPRTFGGDDRKPRTFGDKPRSFGDKPRAFGDKPRAFGDKPRFASDDKKPAKRDHESFNDEKLATESTKPAKSFDSKPKFGGSFERTKTSDRPRFSSDKTKTGADNFKKFEKSAPSVSFDKTDVGAEKPKRTRKPKEQE